MPVFVGSYILKLAMYIYIHMYVCSLTGTLLQPNLAWENHGKFMETQWVFDIPVENGHVLLFWYLISTSLQVCNRGAIIT